MKPTSPSPRASVTSPDLVRPAWTSGKPRDANRLWLDKNENIDPILAKVTAEILRSISAEALFTYPETGPLYRKLAASLSVAPENLVLTAGADGAIRAIFEAYVDPGDVVLHTAPSFAMYSVYSKMYGAKVVPLEYETSNIGPRLLAARVVEAIEKSRPKVLFLPNPDSPTGTVFEPTDLREIIGTAQAAGTLVLVDEAYFPFYRETVLPWIIDYANLVICRSTAKAWGLAGLRIGYAAACPEVAKVLHQVRPMYEVNTVAVAVLERLLDHEDAMQASVARLEQGKSAFKSAMHGLGLKTLPAHGNFLHVAFGPHADAVHAALSDLVYYRRDFAEPSLKGFSRFSMAPVDMLQPIIDRISGVVAGRARASR